MTEHGPQGGDEINTLLESEFNQYVNFGWPVASYGKVKYNVIEELKYENHAENGFKEPAYWYKKNSIAPSAIINADGFFKNSEGDFLCRQWEIHQHPEEDLYIILDLMTILLKLR